MKAFITYTLLRLLLFVTTYAVVAGLWTLTFGQEGVLLVPFLAAIIISSLLSLKFLAPQRRRFAESVEARARRATQKFEERKAREDASD